MSEPSGNDPRPSSRPDDALPDWTGRALHFVGIGGAGMSGLALVARALGASVTGSDRAESPYLAPLREAGIEPAIGHDADAVPAGAEVVASTAIAADNPELAVARERGGRVLHRGDLLAEVSRLRRSIAISGTHGKTTSAAMVAHVLERTGLEPTYLIGAELGGSRSNARLGAGEWAVLEADESDRSFLKLERDVAVVTNVELDHHATYRSSRELEDSFDDFLQPAGRRIVWVGAVRREGSGAPPAPGVRLRIAEEGGARTFGIGEGDLSAAEVRLDELGSTFMVEGVTARLGVPGEHNVLNALAAMGACEAAGVSLAATIEALADFRPAGRRFEPRGLTASGARVFDDYAHHPTEVRATLTAARALSPRRLVACFQPHLYSRTRAFTKEFGQALALADAVCVLPIYPARELAEDYPGTSGWQVAAAASDAAGGRPVWWAPTMDDAERLLVDELGEGDVLLTLGAGDVDRVAERLAVEGAA